MINNVPGATKEQQGPSDNERACHESPSAMTTGACADTVTALNQEKKVPSLEGI